MVDVRGWYELLLDALGPTDWWPADSRFEVAVGAILTQNTAWGNVETAIELLSGADALDPWSIRDMPDERLWELIRPSGYYRLKAQYLKAFCAWFAELCERNHVGQSGTTPPPDEMIPALVTDRDDHALRQELLAIRGIGGETADDILLYVFDRPAFIADRYARRMIETMGVIDLPKTYEGLRRLVMPAIENAPDGIWSIADLKEFHGLIDELGKTCRSEEDWRQTIVATHRLTLR